MAREAWMLFKRLPLRKVGAMGDSPRSPCLPISALISATKCSIFEVSVKGGV